MQELRYPGPVSPGDCQPFRHSVRSECKKSSHVVETLRRCLPAAQAHGREQQEQQEEPRGVDQAVEEPDREEAGERREHRGRGRLLTSASSQPPDAEVRGETALQAGITLTAGTIFWTAGSWIQARYQRRWDLDRFIRTGLFIVIIGLTLFTLVLSPAVPSWMSVPLFGLAGLGMGMAYAPTTLLILREAPPAEQGSASSALQMFDALGTALGTGVTGAAVAASVRATGVPTTGLAVGFGIAIGVGILGLAMSGRLRSPRRASGSATVAEAASAVSG